MIAALEAVAAATSNGIPKEDAIEIGRIEGSKNATTWADITRSGNALAATYGANFPALAKTGTKNSNNHKKKKTLASVAPFIRGNVTTNDNSIAAQRPQAEYMKNKCLVIRGIKKETSREEFLSYINNIAGEEINIILDKVISRDYSPWLTVAVEVNEADYAKLANTDIWSNDIQIRNFVGWRWWRSERPKRMTLSEIKNSVRMQWS